MSTERIEEIFLLKKTQKYILSVIFTDYIPDTTRISLYDIYKNVNSGNVQTSFSTAMNIYKEAKWDHFQDKLGKFTFLTIGAYLIYAICDYILNKETITIKINKHCPRILMICGSFLGIIVGAKYLCY